MNMTKMRNFTLACMIFLMLLGYVGWNFWNLNHGEASLLFYMPGFEKQGDGGTAAQFELLKKHEFTHVQKGYVYFLVFMTGIILSFFFIVLFLFLNLISEYFQQREEKRRESSRDFYLQGLEYFFRNNLNEAEKLFEKASLRDKNNSDPYLRLADIAFKRGNYHNALDRLESAKAMAADSVAILLGKASCYHELREYLTEKKCLELIVLKIDSANSTAFKRLLEVYQRLAQWQEAYELLNNPKNQKLLAADPELKKLALRIRYEYAKQAWHTGKDSLLAMKELREIMEADKSFSPAAKLLSEIYAHQQKFDKAIKLLKDAYKLYPESIYLLWIEKLCEDSTQSGGGSAEAFYQDALNNWPDDTLLKLLYSRYLILHGQAKTGLDLLTELEQKGLRTPAFHVLKALAYQQGGLVKDALQEFKLSHNFSEQYHFPVECSACHNTLSAWADRCPTCNSWDSLKIRSGQELVLHQA
jgi:lipopolysaccharide biosynthesis regulator YciM